MNASLRARIERLERRSHCRPFLHILLHIHGRDDEAEVVGYRAGKLTFLRGPSEPLQALQARAFASGASITLGALYRPENRPAADVAEPTAAPVPVEPIGHDVVGSRAVLDTVEDQTSMDHVHSALPSF